MLVALVALVAKDHPETLLVEERHKKGRGFELVDVEDLLEPEEPALAAEDGHHVLAHGVAEESLQQVLRRILVGRGGGIRRGL
eukprot:2660350-Pyramimonas_sp.AAC.3